jgi:RHS repeat-associated protein
MTKIRGILSGLAGLLALYVGLVVPVHATQHTTYFITNAQGTVVATADSQGNVTYTAAYRPYGQQQVGALQPGPGYTGHVNDPGIGLVYMQARYYDPSIGRFMSIDPVEVKAGNVFLFSRYAYAWNSPIKYIDPYGQYVCKGTRSQCNKVKKFYGKIKDAQSKFSKTSRQYRALGVVLNYLKSPGEDNGVTVAVVGMSGKSSSGDAKNNLIRLDLRKILTLGKGYAKYNNSHSTGYVTDVLGAGELAHESQHELDARDAGGVLGVTFPANEAQDRVTEINAYTTESYVGQGLGVWNGLWSPGITRSQLNENIINSAGQSVQEWCNEGGECNE